ncbi:MAG: hypothetical protein IPH10_10690, partial [bacterium]|nr:hypothetical protein [bacterium]
MADRPYQHLDDAALADEITALRGYIASTQGGVNTVPDRPFATRTDA